MARDYNAVADRPFAAAPASEMMPVMNQAPLDTSAAAGIPSDRAFFGHPRGLSTLFFTELWERFSYYGMRAILILFMTAPIAAGGLGMETVNAGAIYGAYVSMVYLLSLPGGWLADKVLGLRRTVFYGGVVIMAGHISLAIPSTPTFYLGLVLVVLGTGCLKPCISALVGQLYAADDVRRDAGFSIYYMGINLGAFLSPLAVGWLAQGDGFRSILESLGISGHSSWHFGFGLAAVGMFFGLLQYTRGARYLGEAGVAPAGAGTAEELAKNRRLAVRTLGIGFVILAAFAVAATTGVVPIAPASVAGALGLIMLIVTVAFFGWLFFSAKWTPEERRRLLVILLLFLASCVFWSAFEQAGSSLNLFAENQTANTILGVSFPASWHQASNALFIILLAPVFAALWVKLGKRDPSTPTKFSFGLLLVGAGFAVMILAAIRAAGGEKVSPGWLILTYLLHTLGELCLSPVGLSAMTRLAPARVSGLMMGVWFLSISVGSYLAGFIVTLYDSFTLPQVFSAVTVMCLVAGAVLTLFIGPAKRLLAR